MRRQVKPFVTEYRGSVRRHKDPSPPVDLQQDQPVPRSKSFMDAPRSFGSDGGSDASYEAALRAADALFAMPARPAAPKNDAPVERSQPDLPAAEAEPLPGALAQDQRGDSAPGDAKADSVEGKAGAPPRRILQAIEPAVEDRFAALEAERAPKRRGRKPGSKNKPKPGRGDDWVVPEGAAAARAGAAPRFAVAPAVIAALPDEVEDDLGIAPEPPVTSEVATPDGSERPIATARSRNDRFGWRRAGLRPGERWKRRLPKTAW